MDKTILELIKKTGTEINIIDVNEIPNIDLYMDQVTTFINDHLEDSKRYEDDKLLTKTMINNYTKFGLLPAPVKKKYSKNHVIMMLFIYYLKNIISIGDAKKMLEPIKENHFAIDSSPDLSDIYETIYKSENQCHDMLSKDLAAKIEISNNSFMDMAKNENIDDKDLEYMQLFNLLNMLSYDVYLKKHIMESIIDEIDNLYSKEPQGENGKKKKKE